jgi:predicted ArsR family transcriptional regulator
MSKQQVYELMEQGITCRKEISQRTGLTRRQVRGHLEGLYRQGKIFVSSVMYEENASPIFMYDLTPKAPKENIFAGVSSIFRVNV